MPEVLRKLSAMLTVLCLTQAAPATAAAQGAVSVPGGFSRPAGGAAVAGAASAWIKGYNSTARLIASAEPVATGRRLLAGVEIRLNDGWKTYWRHPGDDGGLPPTFDWTGSRNLKSARVLYPVPERIKSLNGTSLGYSKAVIFPVEIEPVDPTRPVELALALDYGICREICVPAEARMALTVEPRLAAMPAELIASVQKVPRPAEAAAAALLLKSAKAVLAGPSPSITFDIATAAAGGKPDLFVEAPDGVYLPVPAKAGEAAGGIQRFRIDLKGVEEAAKLAGKPLRLTITGVVGGSELTWIVK